MSAASLKIMIVEDEPSMRNLLRIGLGTHGYHVLEAPNGEIALDFLQQEPKLIILDLGLPDVAGHDLLGKIRACHESVPIVVLSSRADEAGKVSALDMGADDYLTKPFGMAQLLARIRAALRHQLRLRSGLPAFRVGNLSVDLERHIVMVGDQNVKLSPKLLRVLVQHAGTVVTQKILCSELWDEYVDTQYLRVYVRQLRRKIEADPERPRFVLTETGVGYWLHAPDEVAERIDT
jgi:two-component system, OmpR family, KDP operon response regulator KdpE